MNPKVVGSASGALAVLLGAFGAHALQARVTKEELEVWKTASMYHFLHTCALLTNQRKSWSMSNKLFVAGMLVFSGSLYVMVLTGYKKLGAVTPVGGLMLVGGWAAMAFEGPTSM